MIRRLWMVVAAVVVTTLWAVVFVSAQGPGGPAQTDFQPLRDDQIVQEQLPAAPLVFAAYAFVWFALLVYVVSLWRRVSRVEQELSLVSSRLKAKRT